MKSELFIIEPGVWKAADNDEVSATFAGLEEMDLARLPYHRCTVRLPGTDFMNFMDKYGRVDKTKDARHIYCDIAISDPRPASSMPGWIDIECPKLEAVNGVTGYRIDVTDQVSLKADGVDMDKVDRYEKLVAISEQVRRFLIVMLATRNARKTTVIDKLARLGIGAKNKSGKHRYTHVTTIALPRPEDMDDDHEHKATGATKAPHLRRGHIRNQHYGPKGSYIKRVWIEPVFVNADPDFVSKRAAYNVITGAKERTDA